jgi:hypothetical protein
VKVTVNFDVSAPPAGIEKFFHEAVLENLVPFSASEREPSLQILGSDSE